MAGISCKKPYGSNRGNLHSSLPGEARPEGGAGSGLWYTWNMPTYYFNHGEDRY